METRLGVWYNTPMQNIFGTETVYVCNKCGGQNVVGQYSTYRRYNEPFNPTLDWRELLHEDFDWCNDCDEETLAIEFNQK